MIGSIDIKIATREMINERYRDKKRYCKSYRFYKLKCIKGNCNGCDHCIETAFIKYHNIINYDATLFLRKHKKIKNNDSDLIDYIVSIVQHELTHIILLDIGEISAAYKYDNIARFIEERKGFPKDFYSKFDYENYEKNVHYNHSG